MKRKQQTIAILAIFILAVNMRAPLVSLGALTEIISSELEISSNLMGLLTTLPLITFSVAPLLIAPILRRFSLQKTIVFGIVLIVLGGIIRAFTSIIGIFIGTFFMGLGIGFENVLILRFIKTHFKDKIGFVTGYFSSAMSFSSGIGAWLSLELMIRYEWTWRWAVSVWISTALIALVFWCFQVKLVKHQKPNMERKTIYSLKVKTSQHHLLIYISMQSFLFYCMVAWLPSMLRSAGANVNMVGKMSFLLQLVSVPAGLLFPIIAQKLKKFTFLIILAGILLTFGIVILQTETSLPFLMVSVVLFGVGLGGSFSMGMVLINSLTEGPEQATYLAVRSLSIGYLVASVGPLLLGSIYEKTRSWNIPIYILFLTVLIMVYYGFRVNKKYKI